MKIVAQEKIQDDFVSFFPLYHTHTYFLSPPLTHTHMHTRSQMTNYNVFVYVIFM